MTIPISSSETSVDSLLPFSKPLNSTQSLSEEDILILEQNAFYNSLADKSVVIGVSEDGKPILDATSISLKPFPNPTIEEDTALANQEKIPKFGKMDYQTNKVSERRHWLEEKTKTSLEHIGGKPIETEKWQGNIENLIGTIQIPVGITGPLVVHGEYAKGTFYVPMATTEGAILTVYTNGMKILSNCGGVHTFVKENNLHISPVFLVKGLNEGKFLIKWIEENFHKLKTIAESTTSHGKLLDIKSHLMEKRVVLQFIFSTGDAQGMNMINVATEKACQHIKETLGFSFTERSNYSAVKKISSHLLDANFGKAVFAEATITRHELKKLRTTPEMMAKVWQTGYLASSKSYMFGINCQAANCIAAIYLACGQDAADIVTSHIGHSHCEVTEEGDLYFSVTLPSLLLGTVGGGTGLGTQKECLNIMDCYGSNKALKFAEIIAASVLAGEVTTGAALATGNFVRGHATLGRNKPTE